MRADKDFEAWVAQHFDNTLTERETQIALAAWSAGIVQAAYDASDEQ